MIQAISSCPTTIAEILVLVDKVTREELRIDEIVDGFIESEDETMIAAEESSDEVMEDEEDEDEEDVDDSEEDAEAVAAANLAKLKIDALERFAIIRELFIKIGKAYEKHGYRSAQYNKLQEQITNELTQFRFLPSR